MTVFNILSVLAAMLAGIIGNIVASQIFANLKISTRFFIFLVFAMIGLVMSSALLGQMSPSPASSTSAPTPSLTVASAPTPITVISVAIPSSIPASPASSLLKATTEPPPATICRLSGPNEYFVCVPDTSNYKLGDLLVVYARDPGSQLYVYGVMSVLEKTSENLLARLIFQKPNIEVTTLSYLKVDTNIDNINFEGLVPVDATFVGFTLDEKLVRIRNNAGLQSGTELEAVRLSGGGLVLSFNPTATMSVDTIGADGKTISVSGYPAWPVRGTLVVLRPVAAKQFFRFPPDPGTPIPCINVGAGNTVKILASGTVKVGPNIGELNPDGKEYVLGFTIDRNRYNLDSAYRHGSLLFRIKGSDKWMSYQTTQTFIADRPGCMEFEVNDNNQSDNSGDFEVEIEVLPESKP